MWALDERRHAVRGAVATVGAAAVWALQMNTYFFAYGALHNHNAQVATDRAKTATA
ncbi:hypothetical protein ABZ599_18215 [Streptomyces misionensis]|uniref:hypothetical protein n=1 Tax=Streptomyces misionensis TaxID=67331 RepID=UPI0033DC0DA2